MVENNQSSNIFVSLNLSILLQSEVESHVVETLLVEVDIAETFYVQNVLVICFERHPLNR